MQALRKVIIQNSSGHDCMALCCRSLSIDDFAVTVFTIGNQDWKRFLPIFMPMQGKADSPELRPLSTIIFIVVLTLLIVINHRTGKAKNN